eukprot:COSAG02_NODE_4675_length_5106_cov_3.289595_3_plen_99_part_00
MDGFASAPRGPLQVQRWAHVVVYCLPSRQFQRAAFEISGALRCDRGSVNTGPPPRFYDELTIEQKAALEPPGHHSRRAKQSNNYQQLRDRLAAAAARL